MYQETNRDLQKSLSVASASTSVVTDHSTLEADHSNNADGSMIEETPGRAKKRARKAVAARGRARKNKLNKTDSASQVRIAF